MTRRIDESAYSYKLTRSLYVKLRSSLSKTEIAADSVTLPERTSDDYIFFTEETYVPVRAPVNLAPAKISWSCRPARVLSPAFAYYVSSEATSSVLVVQNAIRGTVFDVICRISRGFTGSRQWVFTVTISDP